MMVIPAFIGYFIDQKFGTVILFTALGLVLGVTSAVFQLIKLVSTEGKQGPVNGNDDSSSRSS